MRVSGGLYAINVNRANFRVRVHPLTDTDGDGLPSWANLSGTSTGQRG